MKGKIRRFFYPVGHGNFCEERHYYYHSPIKQIFNVIYDCGSRRLNAIHKSIDMSCKNDIYPVDLLFISHFDSDHVNGIEYLYRKRGIKNIVMPYIEESDKIYYLINYGIRNSIESYDFFEGLINGELQGVSFTLVKPSEKEYPEIEVDTDETEDEYLSSYYGFNLRNHATGSKIIHCNKTVWEYIPFYLKSAINIDDFVIKLKEQFPGLIIGDNIDSCFFKNNVSKIGNYIKYQLNQRPAVNRNSLVVYSGALSGHVMKKYKGLLYSDIRKTSCLFCGDYDSKTHYTALLAKFGKRLHDLGVIQIPHHGSKHNYNHNLITNARLLIICANSGSKKHPDPNVVTDIKKHNKLFKLVSEYNASLHLEYINIW